jgi:hypothetical protein
MGDEMGKTRWLFLVAIILFFASQSSANLIGIEPGTIFAPSDSKTQYVLWDISMHSISINNWTIYLEDHLFNIEPTIGTASIDINHWRPPTVNLKVTGGNINFNIGGYVPNKHYRFNIDNVYHSVQATSEGQLQVTTTCTTVSTTGEWDINVDGAINVLDLSAIISKYGLVGDGGWIPSDINDDGRINVLELSAVLSHYGSHN